jgi:hypothetical protein
MAIYFSRNALVVDKTNILQASGIPSIQCFDTYLGLPAMVGRSRTAAFKGIIDKVWKKLQDWKLKLLSQAGKEVLLKAVIQAIPTYCMSVFLLPKTLCSEINSLMQHFWWKKSNNESNVHWMSWRRMGRRKNDGGMGFRDFNSFNKALLAKQVWRLWQTPDSFLARIMKGKYYSGGNILDASLGAKPSYAWRSIHGSCELLKYGLIWRVGNGAKIRIWKDKWIPRPSTYRVQSIPRVLHSDATVSDLIDGDTRWWNKTMLETLFSSEEVHLIQSLPVSHSNREDRCIWRGTKNGIFSVRSAYFLLQEMETNGGASWSGHGRNHGVWSRLWKLRIANGDKHFLWRACNDILPTRSNLYKKKIVEDELCPICGREQETTLHILWECSSAMDVWSVGPKSFQKKHTLGFTKFSQLVEDMLDHGEQGDISMFVGIARRLWYRRNDVVFNGSMMHPLTMVQHSRAAMEEYAQANEFRAIATVIPQTLVSNWCAPDTGWLKLNWDASLFIVHIYYFLGPENGLSNVVELFKKKKKKILISLNNER